MILAAYYDGTYKALLLLHLFAVIIGFGAVFTNSRGGRRRKQPSSNRLASVSVRSAHCSTYC